MQAIAGHDRDVGVERFDLSVAFQCGRPLDVGDVSGRGGIGCGLRVRGARKTRREEEEGGCHNCGDNARNAAVLAARILGVS